MAEGFTITWPIGERQKVEQVILIHDRGLRDLRPIWDKLIPNLRQRHSVTFRQERNPFNNNRWARLSKKYAEYKETIAPGKRILELSGRMRRAASKKGAMGQIAIIRKRSMEFGVSLGVIYPLYHQTTSRKRKDGTPIKRVWFGVKTIYLGAAINQAFKRMIDKSVQRIPG